jgi:hypothetical protein
VKGLDEAREAIALAVVARRDGDSVETVGVLVGLAQAKATFAVAEELAGLRSDLNDRTPV